MAVSKLKFLEILGRINLFKSLSPVEREQLLKLPNAFQVIPPDECFIHEGAHEPFFYIVLSGKAEVKHNGFVVATIEPGQFIGEVGFICSEPRTASVTSQGNMAVMRIDGQNFQKLPIKIRENIKDKIIYGLVQRIGAMTDNVVEIKQKEMEEQSQHATPELEDEDTSVGVPSFKKKSVQPE